MRLVRILETSRHAQFSCPVARERTAALNQLATAQKWVKMFQDDIASGQMNRVIVGQASLPNAQAALATAQAAVQQIEAQYPAALSAEILQEWVTFPSFVRCKKDLTDPGCLNNQLIEQYATKIVTR